MKKYKPQKLLWSQEISPRELEPQKQLVCFPDTKWFNEDGTEVKEIEVWFDTASMVIQKTDIPCFKTGPYKDLYKHGREYHLLYYYWKPVPTTLF